MIVTDSPKLLNMAQMLKRISDPQHPVELIQLTYFTYSFWQTELIEHAVIESGANYSILGDPENPDAALILVQGTAQELDDCVRNVGRLLPHGR